jgi:hypothetical protein
MTEIPGALAGVFVTSRGDAIATGLTVGIGGIAGAAAGVAADSSAGAGAATLPRGKLGYLAVTANDVVIVRAKRGAFKPKATDEVVLQLPRTELTASRYRKGKAVGVFELVLSDGETWAFDVGRAFATGAMRVAHELGTTVE